MNQEYAKAFAETLDIINNMEEDLKAKIPHSFIKLLSENMEHNYKPNIDYSIDINDQELLKETRALLSLIYRNFICSADERKRLEDEDRIIINKEKEEKFKANGGFNDLDDLMASVKQNHKDESNEVLTLVTNDNKKWYENFLNFFRKMFKR